MTAFLSLAELARNPQVQALRALLDPAADGVREDAHHRLIWSLFAGEAGRARDFLWRAEGRGRFLILSAQPPTQSPLFEPLQVKEFAPALQAGDELAFVLRANATRTRKTGAPDAAGKRKRQHIDLVMDRIYPVADDRAAARAAALPEVARDWLTQQGVGAGFRLLEAAVDDYSVRTLPRRGAQARIGILDIVGRLQLTDPALFRAAQARGFGRAKAFGCGLMLIRRMP